MAWKRINEEVDARCEIDEFSSLAEANNSAVAEGGLSREAGKSVPEGVLDAGDPGDAPTADTSDSPPKEAGCPDLAIEIVDWLRECESGFHSLDHECTVEVSVRVSNVGNLDAGVFWVWASDDYGSDSETVSGLASGESMLLTLSYEYATIMVGGADVIEVRIDVARARYSECTTLNNQAHTGGD